MNAYSFSPLYQVAKAELAKVRQQRPFEFETVNIQDAGQERWKRKYVYWIPALHVEGREVAKGRWDAQTVSAALDTWEAAPWTKEDAQTRMKTNTKIETQHKGAGEASS